jgi:hypothetical protein
LNSGSFGSAGRVVAPVVGVIVGSDGKVEGIDGGEILGNGGIMPLPDGVGIDGVVAVELDGLVVGRFAGPVAGVAALLGGVFEGGVGSSFLHPTSADDATRTAAANTFLKLTLRLDMYSP